MKQNGENNKPEEQKKPSSKKVEEQITGKSHESNNDGAPVEPKGYREIKSWAEAQPEKK